MVFVIVIYATIDKSFDENKPLISIMVFKDINDFFGILLLNHNLNKFSERYIVVQVKLINQRKGFLLLSLSMAFDESVCHFQSCFLKIIKLLIKFLFNHFSADINEDFTDWTIDLLIVFEEMLHRL